jgi:hypothetical protein
VWLHLSLTLVDLWVVQVLVRGLVQVVVARVEVEVGVGQEHPTVWAAACSRAQHEPGVGLGKGVAPQPRQSPARRIDAKHRWDGWRPRLCFLFG